MVTPIDVAAQYNHAQGGLRRLWAAACWSARFSRLCRERFGHAPTQRIDAETLQTIFRRCGA